MLHYRIVLFFLLLVLSYQGLAKQATTQALFGVWQGAGSQDNGSHWTIRINAQKDFVIIDYPSLTCGGVLKPIKSKNMSFIFKEKLRYGIKQCLDNGKVVLIKTANNKLRYHWFGDNGLLQATGDLTKVE